LIHEPAAARPADLFAALPPEWPEADLRARIRRATIDSGQKVVVLDDDPTGTQTVHSLPVLTEWTPQVLAAAWEEAETTFYILTNSRRHPSEVAAQMNREIAHNVARVARQRGVEPVVVSRSDSTLRGHYPGEVAALSDALEEELGIHYDGIVLAPFFLEGGRYTLGDVHWVQSGEILLPAAQTEFAQDATFGYRHSDLRQWVAEKTGGRVPADSVLSVRLEDARSGGPACVARLLEQAQGRQPIVVNALSYRDLEVLVWGMMQAEGRGKRFLSRTAASFVQVRGGIPDRGLLTAAELWPAEGAKGVGGLTVAGSYVQRTTDQLARALKLAGTVGLELCVRRVLDRESRAGEIARVARRLERALDQGSDAILYTSRELFVPPGATQLQAAQQVSDALVSVLRELSARPRYLIGKGGITSSDLATAALGVRRARVLGQIAPGVPVWRLGPESRYPELPYVVFPGNVGGPDTLAAVIETLRGH
jgi:uncharacterized protein YgbK (DUF1537 family)